jgi:hypothetical protein
MSSDTFSVQIGTIGPHLGTIVRELVRIADRITNTGRGYPRRRG